MDFVRRLILFVCLLCPLASFATVTFYIHPSLNLRFASASDACGAGAKFYGYTSSSVSGSLCTMKAASGSTSNASISTGTCPYSMYTNGMSYGYPAYVCTDTVQCPSGQSSFSGVCAADPDSCSSKAGTPWPAPSAGGAWNSGSRAAYTFCPQTGGTTTCVVIGSSRYTSVSGDNFIAGPWTYTGGLCSQSGLGTGSEAQSATFCPKGQCPGVVNGQSVCVACASVTEDKSTQVSTAASSAASGATTTTTTTSGSSSSSSTTCTGTKCTTTTTTSSQNADGSTGQTATTKTESKSDFCTTNPKAAACADASSSFGGSCGAFTCDGDAVQCATARAVQQSQCESHIDQTDPMVTAGTLARTSDFSRGDPRNGGSVDVTSFDQTERYAGSCPTDPVIAVMGKSITVPLSRGCTYLGWLGQAAVAVCLIAAARIALGGA